MSAGSFPQPPLVLGEPPFFEQVLGQFEGTRSPPELFDEPQRLGDFIAARSWNTSARFQNLVQAPALVGQSAES